MKNLQEYLDALVDQDGLKTEITITLTNPTLWKVVGGLAAAGVGIALMTHLMKNAFPNKQLAENNRLLQEIQKSLQT